MVPGSGGALGGTWREAQVPCRHPCARWSAYSEQSTSRSHQPPVLPGLLQTWIVWPATVHVGGGGGVGPVGEPAGAPRASAAVMCEDELASSRAPSLSNPSFAASSW